MREISSVGLDLIKSFESFSAYAYLPTKNDVWTIGYGHTKGVGPHDKCTEEEALAFLAEDVSEVEDVVNKLVTVPLSQNQFDALVSFTFNVGGSHLFTSTILHLLNQAEYEEAAEQFKFWKYQNGVVLNGLVRRRAAEAELFLKKDEETPCLC